MYNNILCGYFVIVEFRGQRHFKLLVYSNSILLLHVRESFTLFVSFLLKEPLHTCVFIISKNWKDWTLILGKEDVVFFLVFKYFSGVSYGLKKQMELMYNEWFFSLKKEFSLLFLGAWEFFHAHLFEHFFYNYTLCRLLIFFQTLHFETLLFFFWFCGEWKEFFFFVIFLISSLLFCRLLLYYDFCNGGFTINFSTSTGLRIYILRWY